MNLKESFSHCDLSEIPFPEWSDQDVNSEKWEMSGNRDIKKTHVKEATQIKNLYIDDQDVQLPSSIPVAEWKRPAEIYPNADFVITSNQFSYTDLKNGSEHLLKSDFMNQFLTTVGILDYIGNSCPWKFESVGAHYTPNPDKPAWKPWHHIYSMNKISKGQPYSPKFNPSGKYVVRLYWLGRWRKIYVDDRLPVNEENIVLLPNHVYESVEFVLTPEIPEKVSPKSRKPAKKEKNKKAKDVKPENKMEVELWPFILCKAMLKIACLSWNKHSELVDFNPINCLTGWICQLISTSGLSSEELWRLCVQYTPTYIWPEDEAVTKPKKSDTKKGSKGKKDKSSSKGSKKSTTEGKDKESGGFKYHVVACCSDLKPLMTGTEAEQFSSTEVLIEQSRDIPLAKPPPRPEYARWKRFRWIIWALRKGIIPPFEDTRIKYLKIFSNLTKNVNEELKGEAKIAIDATKSKSKKSVKSSSKKESKSSKSSKKVDAGQLKIFSLMERSMWINFNEIVDFIEIIYIFFKPSEFETEFKISDIDSFNPQQSTKKDNNVVEMLWPSKIYESRNEPLYIFMDSLIRKYLIVNLAQMGNVNQLKKNNSESGLKFTPLDNSEYISEPYSEGNGTKIAAPFAYVILETYNWQTNSIGYINMFLNTCATKTFVISFKPGRSICRIWLRSDNFYVLTLLTDIPTIVGNIEAVLVGMTHDPMSLIQFCQEVSIHFGKLVQAYGTDNFKDCLKTFHKTYKTDMTLSKIKSHEIYNIFIHELLNVLKELGQTSDIFALKVLFLDPNIRLIDGNQSGDAANSTKESIFSDTTSQTEEELDSKNEEMAAVKIQSTFKLLFVKKILAYHDQAHRKYPDIYETLKRIYANVFSVQKRSTLCIKLLRSFLQKCADTINLGTLPICADLSTVVNILSFNGYKSLSSDSFAIICRYAFECNSEKPLIIKICLFVNLARFMVRVFDNDSEKEIFRFTNTTFVWSYQKNEKGYTVLCYGWTRQPTKLTWKLCFIYVKENDAALLVPDQDTTEDMIKDYYKPNVNNMVCKCNLNVKQNTFITLRLATSSNDARLQLRCLNDKGEILASAYGVANVILPICYLTCWNSIQSVPNVEVIKKLYSRRKSNSLKKASMFKNKQSLEHANELTTNDGVNYIIEAVLLDQSWPLSINEWLIVNYEKARALLYPHTLIHKSGSLISRESDASKELSKFEQESSFTADRIQSPCWSLSIAYNIEDIVTFSKDTNRIAEINRIKRSWYENDESRPAKSRRMRFEYLRSHSTKGTSSSPIHTASSSSLSTDQSPLPSYISPSSKDSSTSKKLFNKWNIESQMLPPYDLSQYLNKDSIENPNYVKKDEWQQSLCDTYEEKSTHFAKLLQQYKDSLDKLRDEQLENFVIVKNWFNKCREDSYETMQQSYKLRDDFIDSLIQASKSNITVVKDEKKKGKTKETKSKKKKK